MRRGPNPRKKTLVYGFIRVSTQIVRDVNLLMSYSTILTGTKFLILHFPIYLTRSSVTSVFTLG